MCSPPIRPGTNRHEDAAPAVTFSTGARKSHTERPKEVHDVEKQEIMPEQEICELDIEFVGELEDITAGWTGPTNDGFDGDWTE
jgi:hypothetical protein